MRSQDPPNLAVSLRNPYDSSSDLQSIHPESHHRIPGSRPISSVWDEGAGRDALRNLPTAKAPEFEDPNPGPDRRAPLEEAPSRATFMNLVDPDTESVDKKREAFPEDPRKPEKEGGGDLAPPTLPPNLPKLVIAKMREPLSETRKSPFRNRRPSPSRLTQLRKPN